MAPRASCRWTAPRNGQQSVVAVDIIALMDALKIPVATVAGCDWGARTACIMAALWPERVKALVSVSGYLIGSQEAGKAPLPPQAELQWWYQYYFATERGRAGYEQNRHDFAKLIWQTASPRWNFDAATFERSAVALDNPDHVAVTVHNYRWRLGLAEGEAKYQALENRLARAPVIGVPTITLEGDANGAPHPEPSAYAKKFSGRYEHRLVSGGIGHNLPQEAPGGLHEGRDRSLREAEIAPAQRGWGRALSCLMLSTDSASAAFIESASVDVGRRQSGIRAWLCFALFSLCIAMGMSPAFAQTKTSLVPVPQMKTRVVDLTNTLSAGDADGLRQEIAELESSTQAQLAVLIVPTTGQEAIEQYAARVFARWKLGRKDEDDGVLVLVALKDRKMRIEVGKGLEGMVTDIQAAAIIDKQMAPRFRGPWV